MVSLWSNSGVLAKDFDHPSRASMAFRRTRCTSQGAYPEKTSPNLERDRTPPETQKFRMLSQEPQLVYKSERLSQVRHAFASLPQSVVGRP